MQRVLPLLLLPLLLAGRPVAHCHGSRPHVHIGEGHHESCCGAATKSEQCRIDPPSHHDDDAVYVSDELGVAGRTKTAATDVNGLTGLPAASPDCGVLVGPHLLLAHPPPIAAAGSPLFIRHLSLLI